MEVQYFIGHPVRFSGACFSVVRANAPLLSLSTPPLSTLD